MPRARHGYWCVLLALPVLVAAQVDHAMDQHETLPGTATTPYAVDHYTIGGGGDWSTGASFTIQGTIGQPDVDALQPSRGGGFAITGGFWPGIVTAAPSAELFANGFE